MNPFDAIAVFVLGKIKEGIWAAWLKFLFEIAFSAITTFLFVCGTILSTTEFVDVAIGSGMVASALVMVVLFRKESSRLTRGMLVVLPNEEAAAEIARDFQIIEKTGEKK